MVNVAQPETREQIRERILAEMADLIPGKDRNLSTVDLCAAVAKIVTTGIDAALSAEGEVCAQIADRRVLYGIGPMIAEDIRARGSK